MKKKQLSKQKKEEEAVSVAVAVGDNNNIDLYSKSNQATQSIIQSIQSLTTTATTKTTTSNNKSNNDFHSLIPNQILTLKQIQRSLTYDTNLTLYSNLKEKKKHVESQSLLLQNLIYERNHLQREIRECEVGFENVELLKMVKDELDIMDKTTTTTTTNNNNEEEENEENDETKMQQNDSMINSFLLLNPKSTSKSSTSTKDSYRNPTNHSKIISTLYQQCDKRGKLQQQLTNQSKLKLQILNELKEQNEFLNNIPNQLVQLEKWSLGLQDYFNDHRNKRKKMDDDNDDNDKDSGVNGIQMLIGSKRRTRLNYAKELSGPLYTLFIQLQSFMDAYSTNDTLNNRKKNDKNEDDEDDNGNDGFVIRDINDWNLQVIDIDPTNNIINDNGDEKEKLNDSNHEMKKTIHDIINDASQPHHKAIQLWIPIPNIDFSNNQRSKNKKQSQDCQHVKIQFEYYTKLQIVTAHVVDLGKTCANKLWWASNDNKGSTMDTSNLLLLHNLFDNDSGMYLPHGCAADLCYGIDKEDENTSENQDMMINNRSNGNDMAINYDEESISEENDISLKQNNHSTSFVKRLLNEVRHELIEQQISRKPYNWCQYLAGLYYPTRHKKDQSDDGTTTYQIDPTTKSTLMRVYRRVRSHVTLATLIKALMAKEFSNSIPMHPSMKNIINEDEWNYKCRSKLDVWSVDINATTKGFGNKCYKAMLSRKSKILNLRVEIDPRYPVVPPTWSLQPNDVNGDNHQVSIDYNVVMALNEVNSLQNMPKFINNDVEESFYWILLHQLRAIMIGWDKYQETLENRNNGDHANIISNGLPSLEKGQENRLMNAAFDLFKHGV